MSFRKLPGCLSVTPTAEEALAKVPEAITEYWQWLQQNRVNFLDEEVGPDNVVVKERLKVLPIYGLDRPPELYGEGDTGATSDKRPIRRRRNARMPRMIASTGNTKMLKTTSQTAKTASHPANTSAAFQASCSVPPKLNPDGWVCLIGRPLGWRFTVTL